jgi:DNA-binding IclR family transcriptional regulator
LGVDKSTASRLLRKLQEHGFVERAPHGTTFRLGLRLLEYAGAILSRLDVRMLAYPHLSHLAETTGETANLAVWDGSQAVNVAEVQGSQSVRYVGWLGRRTPHNCSATGKTLLAFQPQHVREAVLAGLHDPV